MDQAIDRRKILSDEELNKVVRKTYSLKQEVHGIAIRFIAATGCRLKEALLVYPSDLGLDESIPCVRIPTLKRGGRPVRTVHLHDAEFVRELAVWRKKPDPQDPLFKCGKRTLQTKLEKIFEELKIRRSKDSLIHILRHTRASQLVAAGYDFNYVRQQLGWNSLDMAKIYVHADEKKIAAISKRLPKISYRRKR